MVFGHRGAFAALTRPSFAGARLSLGSLPPPGRSRPWPPDDAGTPLDSVTVPLDVRRASASRGCDPPAWRSQVGCVGFAGSSPVFLVPRAGASGRRRPIMVRRSLGRFPVCHPPRSLVRSPRVPARVGVRSLSWAGACGPEAAFRYPGANLACPRSWTSRWGSWTLSPSEGLAAPAVCE